MEDLKKWFLVMLFLHRKVLPKTLGGSPSFYGDITRGFKGSLTLPLRILYRHGSLSVNGERRHDDLRNMREVIKSDNSPLIIELPRPRPDQKRNRGAVLFALTPAGEQRAAELVSEFSERAQGEIGNSIVEARIVAQMDKKAKRKAKNR